MNGTRLYPGGHRLRPDLLTPDELDYLDLDPDVAHMFCRNCGCIDPEPGSECVYYGEED